MNIEEAKQELIHTILAYTAKDAHGSYKIPLLRQRPVLLIGPPGIGKTAIVSQAAKACDVGFVSYTMTHHTRQSAVGLPLVKERVYQGYTHMVTEYTMSEILASVCEYMEKTGKREGILFLDEINCVSETLVPTMLQFLQSKTFGNHRIPQGWILVAAGNPQEYNKSARSLDVVTLDRVRCISVDVDCDTWLTYASGVGIHGSILSYLKAKPGNFYYIEQKAVEKEFVTARGWEDLSVLICSYEELGITVDEQVTGQYLQCEEIARDFAGYYELYCTYREGYDIRGILEQSISKEEWNLQCEHIKNGSVDERFAVVQMLCEALADIFLECQTEDCYMRRMREVAGQLADYQKQHLLDEPTVLLENFVQRFEKSLKIKQEHQILSESESNLDIRIYRSLKEYSYRLRGKRFSIWKEYEDEIRNQLEEIRKECWHLSDGLEKKLFLALKFIQESCGEDAELFTLIEQICLNPAGVDFLHTHPSEELTRYLSLVQLTSQETKLQEEIRNLNEKLL